MWIFTSCGVVELFFEMTNDSYLRNIYMSASDFGIFGRWNQFLGLLTALQLLKEQVVLLIQRSRRIKRQCLILILLWFVLPWSWCSRHVMLCSDCGAFALCIRTAWSWFFCNVNTFRTYQRHIWGLGCGSRWLLFLAIKSPSFSPFRWISSARTSGGCALLLI